MNATLFQHRKLLLSLLMLLTGIYGLYAQCNPNLVPNPGFETGRCGIPAGTFLDNWSVHNLTQTPQTVDNWYNPTNATPDWFNSCTNSVSYTPPITSHAGTYNIQDTRLGSTAHAGFLSYGDTEPRDNVRADYREYLQVRLDAPLIAGARYHVSFYVNLAGFEPADVVYTSNTAYFNYNFRVFGTDKIGAYFSNNPMTDYTMDPLNTVIDVEPQIEYIGAPITEADDWVLISGTFIAVGGEEYMTIGNFRNNTETNFELVRNASTDFSKYPDQFVEPIFQIQEYAYYMLDDVSVIQEPIVNTVDAGPDVTVNEGDSYIIPLTTTGAPPISYTWTPANSLSDATMATPFATPLVTTTYTITVDFGDGCPVSDQVTVTVNPCSLNIDMTNAMSGFIDCDLTQTDIIGIVANNASASATYTWTDVFGDVVGNQLVLTNVGIGRYDLLVSDGPNCEERVSWGVDGDQELSFFEGVLTQSCPTSGNSDGYVSGITGYPLGGTYEWTDASGSVISNGGGINNVGPGIYTVTYTNGTSGQCSISRTFDLTENGICADNCPGLISVEPYANNDRDNVGTFVIDLGDTVSLYAGVRSSVSASADYAWSTPGNPDFHLFQTLSNIAPTETTTYTMEADFGNGCVRSGQITVIVNDPGCPVQLLDGDIIDASCGANNGGIQNITVLNSTVGETYTWTNNGGMTIANSLELTNVMPGEYTLTVDQGAGCQRSRTWTIGNSSAFSIDAGTDVTINLGETTPLQANATGGTPVTYAWSPAAGLNDPNIANPIASPLVTTTYTVTIDFGGGCTDTDTITVTVLDTPTSCAAPNLVPNPSFEEYVTCPTKAIDTYSSNEDIQDFLLDWEMPTNGSSDYYHRCGTGGQINIPTNSSGTQEPPAPDQDAYVGFFALDLAHPDNIEYREYLQARLDQPMVPGTSYTVSIKLNLADYAKYSIDEMGVYFGQTRISMPGYDGPLNVTPQLTTPAGEMLDDKDNWMLFNWEYIATGGEQFMVIGNFKDDANTDIKDENPVLFPNLRRSYYFLDDVSVTETSGTVALDAGPDVTINAGESTQLEALPTGGTPVSYTWSPATGLDDATIADPMASPTVTTTYTVTADFGGGCTATDQVTVTVIDPDCPLMLSGGDVAEATCGLNDGGITGIAVNGNSGTETYSWTDANGMVIGTQSNLANVGLGSYTLTVTEGADCQRTLTFTVNESGPPDLDDTALVLTDASCEGTAGSITGITYIGEVAGAVFRWTDSEGTPVGNALDLEGAGAGTYTLQVTDALGCGAIAGPYTLGSPQDCEGPLQEEGPVRIANTMTPNGDGSNDMFYIEGIEAYPNSVLQVYNRWGNKLYEQRGYQNDWYGTYQGSDLPVATYYYVLSLGDEARTLHKGYIAILK